MSVLRLSTEIIDGDVGDVWHCVENCGELHVAASHPDKDHNVLSDCPGPGLVRSQKPEDVSEDPETLVKQRIVEAASIAPPAVAQLDIFFISVS